MKILCVILGILCLPVLLRIAIIATLSVSIIPISIGALIGSAGELLAAKARR